MILDEWFKGLVGDKQESSNFFRGKAGRYVIIIIICLGLLALVWRPSGGGSGKNAVEMPAPSVSGNKVKEDLTRELGHILSQIEGAGKVEVSITLASDGEKNYAANSVEEQKKISETSPGGSQQTIENKSSVDLVMSSGSPLLVENKFPRIIGVLIVAEGARYPAIKEKLLIAAATLLDIPAHKISVMPGQEGGQ